MCRFSGGTCEVCGATASRDDVLRVCGGAVDPTKGLRHPSDPCGPGCQLRRSLAWFVRDDGKCGCTEYAAQMDAWGPDVCEARIDEIVAHLVEQAAKRSVFLGAVPSAAVTVIVRRAIKAAGAETAAGNSKPSPPEV
jgi:hypothetical protein